MGFAFLGGGSQEQLQVESDCGSLFGVEEGRAVALTLILAHYAMKDDGEALDTGLGETLSRISLPATPNPIRECGIPGQGDKGMGLVLPPRAASYLAPSAGGQLGQRGCSLSPCPAQPHLSRQALPAAEALSVDLVGAGLQLPFVIEPVRNV